MSVIFYQNTTDGRCAAAIVQRCINRAYARSTNFGYVPDWSKLRFGEEVYLLGVHFQVASMFDLEKNYKLTYIDHHESSKRILKDAKFHGRHTVLDTTASTALLTWKYFMEDTPIPKAVEYISEYTLNQIKFGSPAIEFWEGLNSVNTRPDQNELWDKLFSDDEETISRICARGKEIMEYVNMENKVLAANMVYQTEWEGYNCLMVNYRASSSRFFDSILEALDDKAKDIDLLVNYAWLGFRGCWKATVYSTGKDKGINVGKFLEEKYAGGGQPGVGSFLCDELPWYQAANSIIKPPQNTLNEYLNSHIVARQYKQQGNRTLFNQAVYYDVVKGFNCGIINCPEENKNIFDYADKNLPCLDIGITWCWENSGKYKIVIYPLNGKINRDGLIRFIADLGYEGGASIINDGIMYFVDMLPFSKLKRKAEILLTQI